MVTIIMLDIFLLGVMIVINGIFAMSDAMSEPDVVPIGDGRWLVDGLLLVDVLSGMRKIDLVPQEEIGQYWTVGGLV